MNHRKIQVKSKRDYGNYFVTAFILLLSIVLIITHNKASKQDENYLKDFTLYQEAESHLEAGNINEAILILENLNLNNDDEYNLTYRLGYSYLSVENYRSALTMYTKSIDLNPYLVENNEFMYQYAIILANNEQYDSAILVIDRLLTLPMDETFKKTVTELIDSISNMKGSTT